MAARLRTSGSGIELIARPVAFFEDHRGARVGFALLNLAIQHEAGGGRHVTISQTTSRGNLVLNVFRNDDGTYSFTIFGGRINGSTDLGLMLAQMAEDRLHHRLGLRTVGDAPLHTTEHPRMGQERAFGDDAC